MQQRVIFHHYCICRRDDGSLWELGRGSAGVTYKAEDINLQCPVALKVMKTGAFKDESSSAGFLREARASAQMRHRNVASVYHLGIDDDHFFYAMEFIEGETTEALIHRDGPCSVEVALRVARQVARALSAAERHGIVHCDIKPANLMIAFDHSDTDEGFLVKVIDFGMAYCAHAGDPGESGFCGTAQYSSPEQAEESVVDARSDIYSLGCTLWFLLTGSPPFTGSLAKILVQRVQGEPPWEKLKSFPPAVVKLLRILLRRNRDERPGNAIEVQQAIEMCLASIERDQTVRARLAATTSAARRWFSGRPGRKYAATVLAVLLVGAAILMKNSWVSNQLRDSETLNLYAPPPVTKTPATPANLAAGGSPAIEVVYGFDSDGLSDAPAADDADPVDPSTEDDHRIRSSSTTALPGIASADEPVPPTAVSEKPETKSKSVAKNFRSKKAHRSSEPQRTANPFVRINRSLRGLVGRLF